MLPVYSITRDPYSLRVGLLGMNFKTADLELREQVARAAQSLCGERGLFFRHPTVLLSTCNRIEIYFTSEDLSAAHSDLLTFLRSFLGTSFEQRLYSYFGIDCFAHLCKVTSGLDSAILAETEIQRQVKVAYLRSKEIFELPSCFHYLFQKALKVGKTIRSELCLEVPKLSGTIWHLAKEHFGSLENKRILLVGYSEINRGLASFLFSKGIRNFSLSTRNPASVKCEGMAVFDRSLLSHWQEFDLIVSASSAEEYLLTGGSSGGQLIFDLSVPRTVDPAIGDLPGVTLLNIDQINEQMERGQNVEQYESLIWENVVRLTQIFREKSAPKVASSSA